MSLSDLSANQRFCDSKSPETLCEFIGKHYCKFKKRMVYVFKVCHLDNFLLSTTDNLTIKPC